MELLSKKYQTSKEGQEFIQKDILGYYRTKYADYYMANVPKIESAANEIQKLFRNNLFPEMKVCWDTHPDNIGHLISPGCFRCHDGDHKSADGRWITKDCNACHRIVEQGPVGAVEKNIDGLEFRHPVDIGEDWKETNCADCHTGGA